MRRVSWTDSLSGEVGEDRTGGQPAVVDRRPVDGVAAEAQSAPTTSIAVSRSRRFARGREVLVLVGDPHLFDALAGRESVEHRVDELLGGRCTGGHARRCRTGRRAARRRSLTRNTRAHPRCPGELLEGDGVRRVGRADDDDGVTRLGDRHEGRLAVGRGEAQVAATGHPHVGEAVPGGVGHVGPVAVRQRGLCEQGDRRLERRAAPRPRRSTRHGASRRGRRPSCRPPPRGPRGRRRRSSSPCRPAPSPRGAPW